MADVTGEAMIACTVEEQPTVLSALAAALSVPTSGVAEYHAVDATSVWVRLAFPLNFSAE